MKEKMYTVLEFDKILNMLSEHALSDQVKEKIKALEPYMSEAEVTRRIEETTQAKKVMESTGTPPLASMKELEKVLGLLGKDAMLSPQQLHAVSQFVVACNRMKSYLKRAESTFAEVAMYGMSIHDLSALNEEIEGSIRGGMVDDKASTELSTIRKKMIQTNERIKGKLESMLRSNSQYFSETFVVMRNDRFALPVKKDYKSQITGTVLDTSRSGGTYYIEPAAIQKMQEELSMLQIEEENEVRRILYTLTALVEDYLPLIKMNIEGMETLDFLFAKAKLSIAMKAIAPQVTTDKKIIIQSGRHPLIQENTAVPLDFYMGDGVLEGKDIRGVIITGPNTGGKTVSLKTVGLFSLMAQSGLHLPAEKATMSMHNRVLCDIGDGQSITENLSTFSSHMTNIISILNAADDQSLVLLDELGSGTDPAEGMGLATAILEEMAKKECLIVATTHYPEVKEFARKTEGFVNARMAFDSQNLLPLYKLEIGEAGQSCALYIAKRLGLPQKMIERAYAVAYKEDRDIQLDTHYNITALKEVAEVQKPKYTMNPRVQKKEEKNKKVQPRSSKFNIGDSVVVYPQKQTGIVYQTANEKGEVGVQIMGRKKLVNHKRLKLRVPAKELYPDNYDFSIIFDSVENRKARHQIERKHDPNIKIVIEEGKGMNE